MSAYKKKYKYWSQPSKTKPRQTISDQRKRNERINIQIDNDDNEFVDTQLNLTDYSIEQTFVHEPAITLDDSNESDESVNKETQQMREPKSFDKTTTLIGNYNID